jgi:GDP-4-dehydro-6-deoxy-D-mannose reductase
MPDVERILLVTGATGFVGRHVLAAEALWKARGFRVVGASAAFDLESAQSVQAEIAAVRPAAVLHLAAQSNVPSAFRDPATTLRTNVLGTQALVSAILTHAPRARLLLVSSGDVYGRVEEADLPISEAHVPAPRNPYAVSKLASELVVRQWHLAEGLDAVVVRPFNHIGRGQAESFAIASFARQVVEISLGRRAAEITVGDLDATRDFLDVADVIAAYALVAERGLAGQTYNIASGRETRVGTLLERLLAIAGVTARVHVDPSRLRPNEQRRAVGDSRRLQALGWSPRRTLDDSLAELLADWRARLAGA